MNMKSKGYGLREGLETWRDYRDEVSGVCSLSGYNSVVGSISRNWSLELERKGWGWTWYVPGKQGIRFLTTLQVSPQCHQSTTPKRKNRFQIN